MSYIRGWKKKPLGTFIYTHMFIQMDEKNQENEKNHIRKNLVDIEKKILNGDSQ